VVRLRRSSPTECLRWQFVKKTQNINGQGSQNRFYYNTLHGVLAKKVAFTESANALILIDVMNDSKLIKVLTYLGASPFFLAIFMSMFNSSFLGIHGLQWFLTYALVILTFMAGTLWGQVINDGVKVKSIALATNLLTLVAWLAFLLAVPSIVLLISGWGFLALYMLEVFLIKHIKRPDYYLGLRRNVTGLVLIAHAVMLLQVSM
jgi:hypothetical protein